MVTSTGAGPLQRAGEERSGSAGITAFEDQDVDDLAVLVDRAVEVRPAAGDLHVGLIHEPPITSGVTQRPGGVDELWRERGLLRWRGPTSGEETDAVITSRSVSSAPAGYRFPREVIAVAVRWYLRYGLSYRDVEELLAERGIEVDHVTVYRWVQAFTAEFIEAARPARHG